MKTVMKILGIAILIAIGIGFYIRTFDDQAMGDVIIGVAVLASAFVLMPIFLYIRWNGKKLKDYTLTKENMDRMRDKGLD
ncbi:MAG: hypothetical protein RI572_13335 [Salegentibacter sp.]|nr:MULTISPECIES: hypothetical protein [Salegentibacter]MDR9458382.1 hypothetical protein [Salegentibacter sp.]